MEALDMTKFERQTCLHLGERQMDNPTWRIAMTVTKQPLPNSSRATKPAKTSVVLLVWSELILVPIMMGLIILAYVPSPLVSPHTNPSPFLTGGGGDTSLLGDGWYILDYSRRYMNIVGFDEFIAKKPGLPIVNRITKCTLPNHLGTTLLRRHEGVYNKGSRTTLLSEFQLWTQGCIVDSTSQLHRGIDGKPGTQQKITPNDDDGTPRSIPLSFSDALMTFTISLPTMDDLANLPIIDITLEGVWIPLNFNKTHCSLSFLDHSFSNFAQKVTCHPDPILEPPDNILDDLAALFHDPIPIDEPIFHNLFTDTFSDGGYFLSFGLH
jgi:hypothetical protein